MQISYRDLIEFNVAVHQRYTIAACMCVTLYYGILHYIRLLETDFKYDFYILKK